jgi:two-component system, NtrC family, response regulator HydG
MSEKTLSIEKRIRMYEAREAILSRINPEIRSVFDLDKFLTAIVIEIGKMIEADRCSFLVFFPEQRLRITHEYRRDELEHSFVGTEIPLENPAVELQQLPQTPWGFDDTSAPTTPEIIQYISHLLQTRSLLICPIAFQDQLLGILGLHFCHRNHQWLEEEISFIKLLTSQIAIAYRYTLLFNEKEKEVQITKLLLEVSNDINSKLDFQELASFIIDKSIDLLRADYGCIGILNPLERVLSFAETRSRLKSSVVPLKQEHFSLGEHPLLEQRILARQVLYSGDSSLEEELRTSLRSIFRGREALVSPILVGGRVFGTLNLGWMANSPAITSYEVALITGICNQAAVAMENNQLSGEVLRLKRELKGVRASEIIVGSSDKIKKCLDMALFVADSSASVLIQGESGTGKELIANLVHENSTRQNHAYVKINCGAIPEGILEAELFGYEKGAFTDAKERRFGKFEEANKGTLFLDEIGEMSANAQVKLLRVLQDGEFTRLGGNEIIRTDVRIIAATNMDISKAVNEGRFRKDLYYRLAVYPITVPALRERAEDLPQLVGHFLQVYNRKNNRNLAGVSEEAMRVLKSYGWPGNVRELENAIERAVIVATKRFVTVEDLPETLQKGRAQSDERIIEVEVGEPLDVVEKKVILETLNLTGGDKVKAARILKIGRKTLYRRLEQYSRDDSVNTPVSAVEELSD